MTAAEQGLAAKALAAQTRQHVAAAKEAKRAAARAAAEAARIIAQRQQGGQR